VNPLTLSVPPELVQEIARQAAVIVLASQPDQPERWLNVEQAAGHLACGRDRIYALVSARRIPHHRDGSRLLFRVSELDQFVRDGGATRP
jgi:excisionase family DNA binding protein